MNEREIKIYKLFLSGKKKAVIAKELGVSRSYVHDVINRIEKGYNVQLNRCIRSKTFDCKWEHKYFIKFSILDEMDFPLDSLIKEMHKDGFNPQEIANRIGKNLMYVIRRLKK